MNFAFVSSVINSIYMKQLVLSHFVEFSLDVLRRKISFKDISSFGNVANFSSHLATQQTLTHFIPHKTKSSSKPKPYSLAFYKM